jgi:hypothetical protein
MQPKPIQSKAPAVKKPYVKPLVEHVELKVEEAVLNFGCKNETYTNGRGAPTGNCGTVFEPVCDTYGS